MPFVRISVYAETPTDIRKAIADSVYEAMRETIGIPEGDRFIVVTPHGPNELFIDPHFQGGNRDQRFVLVHITLSHGRTVQQKQALYASIAQRIGQTAGVPADNVMTVLTENTFEDWSFSHGLAQFVLNPPAWVRKPDNGS